MNRDCGMIRLGVIGVGNMGSEHCRNILSGRCPEIKVTAAADLREDRRIWAAKHLPGAEIFSSGSELIRSGSCDAVLVCVPHYSHEALTVEALERGLHVLCEKPAAVSLSAAKRMAAAAEKYGKCLSFMFNQRTNCTYRAIHEAVVSGIFGRLKRFSWTVTDWYRTQQYYDSGTWRATWAGEGGGVLLNQCPHQLDLMIWLCGMPTLVDAKCHIGKWHHIEVEDDVSAYLEFPGGATGVFVASTGDLPGTNRLELSLEKGRIVCEDGIVRCWKLSRSERDICFRSDNPWYRETPECFVLENDGSNPQHVGVLNAFAAHLLRGEPLTALAEDGVRETELSNAFYLSAWTGNPVNLPVNEALFDSLLKEKIAGSVRRKTENITYETQHA